MAEMKQTRRVRWLGALSCGFLMLVGCSGGSGDQASGGSSRLTIQLITDNQAVRSTRQATVGGTLRVEPGERLFVTLLVVSVSGADFATITQSFNLGENDQEQVTIELQQRVPTGSNRTIAVSLSNAQGEEIFHGSTTVNLTQATEQVTIGVVRLFLPAVTTPTELTSRLSNRLFRFNNTGAFGITGGSTLRFGALVNNTGRFTLTSGGLTATGIMTMTPQTSTTSQARQEGSSVQVTFSFESSPFAAPGPQTGEAVLAALEIDEFNDALNITTDQGTSVSEPPELAVNEAPNGTILTPAEANITIAAGGTVSFSAACSDPDTTTPFSFAWDFGGGAGNVTGANPGSISFATAGTFLVTLTCTDALGANDATPDTRTVTVQPAVAPNTVRIDSPPGPVAPNTTFTVPIELNTGAVNVVSYLFELTFNAAVVQVASIEGVTPFNEVVTNQAAFTTGLVRFAANNATFAPANGLHTLANITFQVVGNSGTTSPLTLGFALVPGGSSVLVNDAFQPIIGVTFVNGSVAVQ